MVAIGDRRADLRRARIDRMIIPIIALTALDVVLEVVEIIDRAPIGIAMLGPVAPIGERHVVVDADEIDIGIGPKRIEVKIAITASVLRLVSEILRPIRRIADFALRPEDRAALGGQIDQGRHRRKAAVRTADLGQPAHFGADAKSLDPSRRGAKRGLVQDEAIVTPLVRAGVADRFAGDGKICRCGRAEKRSHFGLGGGGGVARSGLPRCIHEGDPPAPRQFGLRGGIGIGIGQAVSVHLIHQDKRVIHHALAPRLGGLNRLDHRCIRRRAAINRTAFGIEGHQIGGAAHLARDGPWHFLTVELGLLHLGFDVALRRAQVIAEPADDQGDRTAIGQFLAQGLERGGIVGFSRG